VRVCVAPGCSLDSALVSLKPTGEPPNQGLRIKLQANS
jgi:hypothetical protein